jgi:hypothetical protein
MVSSLVSDWQPSCLARKLRKLMGSLQVERISGCGAIEGSVNGLREALCLPNTRGSIRGSVGTA